MILYHGSNIKITNIDLSKARPFKDFGRGFYLTEIKEQAERMAVRVVDRFDGNPNVSAFELSNEIFVCIQFSMKIWLWRAYFSLKFKFSGKFCSSNMIASAFL